MTCIQCGFLRLTLELGTPSTGAPVCPGPHSTVHSLSRSNTGRAVVQPKQSPAAVGGGEGSSAPRPGRGPPTAKNTTAAKLGTYHTTREPLPSAGQSQLTHSS